MRSVVCLVLVGLVGAASYACSDVETGPGIYTGRRAGSGTGTGTADNGASPPEPGSQQEHDETDDEGATTVDTGNPNAESTPAPPTKPGESTGEIAVALSTAALAVDLGASVETDVTVEPKGGFKGTITLAASGLPEGATATFAPATVDIGAQPVKAKLSIKVPMSAVPSAANASAAVVVTAKSGAVQATANANLKVNPRITLRIPVNVDALRQAGAGTVYRSEWGAEFGATQTPLKTQAGNGIVVQVFNADSKPHIVHGANGFAHGDTGNPIAPNAYEMQNGKPRARTLEPGANVNGYPHDGSNGPSASFRIRVTQAP
jgi:hypothetical protein